MSKVENLQKDVDSVTQIMGENIDKVIDRGEKLDILDDKSNKMRGQAGVFKKQATTLKRNMFFENIKMMGLIILVILIIIFIIWLIIKK